MADTQTVANNEKKPLRRNWRVWLGFAMIIIFIISKLESKVPEGVEEKFYKNALSMFHDLNVAYENEEMPSRQVISWVTEHAMSEEKYPDDYTTKEKRILELFRKLTVNIGMYSEYKDPELEQVIQTHRSMLAELLEVEDDY